MLRYTFAGDIGDRPAETFLTYYQTHSGPQAARLLERNIFQVVSPSWWLDRATDRFTLRREYGPLLPVHLIIEPMTPTDEQQPVLLKAGTVSVTDIGSLAAGQVVQVQGFRVLSIQLEQKILVLDSAPPEGETTERLRVQLTGLGSAELPYQPDDLAPNFVGTVTATRNQRLAEAAQIVLPETNLSSRMMTFGTSSLVNPLLDYERWLDRPVAGLRSIIHGDLTLESILIEPESGLTWLINFARTRSGHSIYDFLQLEVQVITRLLPMQITETLDLDDEVVAMARSLHTSEPPPAAPHPVLQKPYDLLRQIRYLAGQCLLNPDRWDEYYLGLLMMLLAAMATARNQPQAARLAFAWAAVAGELVDRPLRPAPRAVPVAAKPAVSYFWYALAVAGLLVALLGGGIVTGIIPVLATPTQVAVANTATPTATPTPSPPSATPTSSPTTTSTPTPTPLPTATPTITPGSGTGILVSPLPVYSGPDTIYSAVGNLDKGTTVEVQGTDRSESWLSISWPGGSGWVDADYVEIEGTVNLPTIIPSPPPPFTPTPTITLTPIPPSPTVTLTPTASGTPTASANAPRTAITDTPGYQVLNNQVMGGRAPSSAAFAPHGGELAATEGTNLYTIGRDGGSGYIWVKENETIRPVEGIVWSPNGALIAFVADLKQGCVPPACRRVGLLIRADQNRNPFYLNPPEGYSIGLPRWTQDGRLLVNIYNSDPANGTVYIYDTSGRGQVASGEYILSSSYEGQRFHPWQPGKVWRADQSLPTSYYD